MTQDAHEEIGGATDSSAAPPPAGRLAAGQRIGPYEVAAPLAVGGMGEVYRARDARLGREVAIKILPASLSGDEERLLRFEQEARAAGALSHPSILVVHDVGTHEGAPFLVTELLEGETLRERLAGGPLPFRRAIEIAAEIASGLAAAHDKGIVHRDLKPENVFLTRDGRSKILDFGLAKVAGPTGVDTDADTLVSPRIETTPGMLLGTVGYMSPEQVRGHEADARSDVFALGLILYEMLWGRRAFLGGSRVETMSAILREDPLVSPAPEGLPLAVVRVVGRCMEKAPGDRFQSARDLGFALEALAGGLESGAPGRSGLWAASGDAGIGRTRLAPVARGALLLLLGALLSLVAGRALGPGTEPRITGYRPLLGGLPRPPAAWATDGQRAYYTIDREGRFEAYQAPLAGGEAVRLDLPFEQAFVMDASPRQSAILVVGWDGGLTEKEEKDLPLWIVPVPAGAARNTGLRVRAAAWSPDGERLAFSGGSDDYNEAAPAALSVARADGSLAREIYRGAEGIPWIRWSPDGRRLRFGVFDRPASTWWWMEAPSDGSAPPKRVGRGESGAWTSGGSRFVFGQWNSPGGASAVAGPRFDLYAAPGGEVWRDGEVRPLTFGPFDFSSPVFTPDGRRIVAAGTLRRMELLRWVAAGSRFERAADLPGGFVEFSPDGAWIAWVDPGSLTLWRSRRDGTARLQLTVPPAAVGLFEWSPDSRRIAFVADGTGGREPRTVSVVSRDGGMAESFSDPNDNPVWDPCWLGEGKVSWGNLRGDGAAVFVADLASRATEKLPGSDGMMGAKCARDGRILAARAWSLGYWLYRPETGAWEDLGQASNLWYPTWARDGRTVYGLSLDARALFRFRVGEPGREKVADLGAVEPTAPWLDAWMGLDPDDAPLLLRDTGLSDLFVLDYADR